MQFVVLCCVVIRAALLQSKLPPAVHMTQLRRTSAQLAKESKHFWSAVRKDVVFFVLVFAVFATVASRHQDADAAETAPAAPNGAAFASLAITLWALIFYDWATLPCMDPDDEDSPEAARLDAKWQVISGVAGHSIYYTHQTMSITAIYYTCSALAEFTDQPALRLACYSASLFVAADGVVLTLLWLRLNWLDAGWQRVRRAWETEGGCPNFGAICVAVHVPTSIFALVDVLVLRDSGLLARYTPSLGWTLRAYVYYAFVYVFVCWLNRCACGRYPYPFLVALEKPSKALPLGLLLFAAAVCVFIVAVAMGLHWLVSATRGIEWQQ